MTHKFDIDMAQKVGINAAIIYDNLVFWCLKNKANNTNFHDDKYWTYNSVRAWKELFPYLGDSAIKTALKKLEDGGFIESGNYNKSAYDRTKWYSIIHLSKIANGLVENSQPIPYNKPNNKHKRVQTPTLEQVEAYIEEKQLSVDANKFFEYFEAGDWTDSNGNKVKNWKQKLLTWNNHSKKDDSEEQAGGVTW